MITSQSTNSIVSAAQTANDLFQAAQKDPAAKADLEAIFDSINHGAPWISGVVTLAGMELTQHNINIDSQLLTLVVGGVVVLASYVVQWLKIKATKP